MPTPARTLRLISLGICLACGGLLVLLGHAHSQFLGDDVVAFWQARTLPFFKFLGTPIDVHPVPLHRLVSFALGRLAPMNFDAALIVLLSFYFLGILFLYLALEALRSTPANAFFCAWYAAYIYHSTLFIWWTAALHRLPYICFLALALYSYARFRIRHGAAAAAGVVLSFLGAAGFFEKAVIVAPMLTAVELSLWGSTTPAARRKNASLLAALGALTAMYYLVWRSNVGEFWSALNFNPAYLFEYARVSWSVLLRSTVGGVYEPSMLVVALTLWFALVFVTVRRARSAGAAWLAGFVAVTLCLSMTGLSLRRSQDLGVVVAAFSHRYYPDAMFLMVLYAALAWQQGAAVSTARFDALKVWLAASALVVLTVVSSTNAAGLMFRFYEGQLHARYFMDRFVRDLSRLREQHARLVFVDGTVPKYIHVFGGADARHSILLESTGASVQFSPPRRGVYEITDNGSIVQLGK